MWLARDKDNSLYLYETKPIKLDKEWISSNGGEYFPINQEDIFHTFNADPQWEDDIPIKVQVYFLKK